MLTFLNLYSDYFMNKHELIINYSIFINEPRLINAVKNIVKGIVHPKMIIMSLITHPHVVPKTFVHESTIILMHAYLCLQTRLSAFELYIWYCRECASKTDMKEKKFIFLALKLFLQLYKIIVEPSTWTILTMSLLSFWALNVVVALLSIQGQKALGFDQKIFNLCS